MKVVGISGSPRANGNAEILLQNALLPFCDDHWEVFEFYLSKQIVAPCTACDQCADLGQCTIDDEISLLMENIVTCHAIIIASPVYYRNVTSQLKAVFDCTYGWRNTHPFKGKVGGAIAVGRGTGGGQAIVLTIIYNYLLSCGAYAIPGELNGVSVVADKPGDVLNQQNRLHQAQILGNNVLSTAKLLFLKP